MTVTATMKPVAGAGSGSTLSRSVGQVTTPARFAEAIAEARALAVAGVMPTTSGLRDQPSKARVCVAEAAGAADAADGASTENRLRRGVSS